MEMEAWERREGYAAIEFIVAKMLNRDREEYHPSEAVMMSICEVSVDVISNFRCSYF